jgi:hypothetical protein
MLADATHDATKRFVIATAAQQSFSTAWQLGQQFYFLKKCRIHFLPP